MTFSIDKIVGFDFETRCALSLPKVGTYAYADQAEAIILTYQIGAGDVRLVQREGLALSWDDLPAEFRAVCVDPEFKLTAWNAGFDRAIANYSVPGSPILPPERVLDAMAQAMASNLPAALDQASAALGGPGKQADGKKLIAMFCGPNAADPKDHPEEWRRFCTYAVRDTAILGTIWRQTRALSLKEWRTYWANEALCERGMAVDLPFCQAADLLAIEAIDKAGKRLAELTGGKITSINQHIRLAQWVYDRLDQPGDNRTTEAREIMVTAILEPEERDEDDNLVEALNKISIARGIVERLRDWMDGTGYDDPVLREILELREFGGSAAPKKFHAFMTQQSAGRLRGQIVFNGAAQTGRFSGKGGQPQNLTRTPLGGDYGTWEPGAVDMVTDGCTLDELAAYGDGETPLRKLALIVRPAIIAPPGRTLIKSDYAQVEARGCPWLSKSASGDEMLDYFRAVDADPSLPDLYVKSAAGMLKKHTSKVDKGERQRGKIASLACQFGGAHNALLSMAANYRMYFSLTEAKKIVAEWRDANPWAPAFWGGHNGHESYGLMGAAMRAYQKPKSTQSAGRISFIFEPTYLGGTLFMRLPSGRLLTYPWCKWRDYEVKDKKTKKVLEIRSGLTFKRPGGMRAIYGGLLCENATQATCADLLREGLVVLHEGLLGDKLDMVLHAHDEICIECDDDPDTIAHAVKVLEQAMTFDRPWAKGFPIAVDTTVRFYYSAAKLKDE